MPLIPLASITCSFKYRYLKRSLDILIAIPSLLLLLPIFLAIALWIKLTSPGPVLYVWNVIGYGGRPFRGYKFRTMIENADDLKQSLLGCNEMSGPVFKMKADPRVTPAGRVLRRFSLDELPQVWSVIKGDMSLVGPRPAGPQEWENYAPWQRRKLSVTPGLSCLWQVSGRNQIHDFDEWVKLDLEYIDRWSLGLDFKILLLTFKAVIQGTGL